ncbi:MAG: hypothetical protein JJ902_05260 [Roseibium sp.]|nr:hypothetical protein [Roseibium sp.]
MRYAGLDVSKSCTGWGLVTPSGAQAGTFRCPIHRPFNLPKGKLDATYAGKVGDWFFRQLDAWLCKMKPDIIAIEQPKPGNLTRNKTEVDYSGLFAGESLKTTKVGNTNFETSHMLQSLAFGAAAVCVRRGLEPRYVPVKTWRSTVGIKTAPANEKNPTAWYKKQAKTLVSAHGHDIKSGDAAEGLCIAFWLREQHAPTQDLFSVAS